MTDRCPSEPLICPFPNTLFDRWYRYKLAKYGDEQGRQVAQDAIFTFLGSEKHYAVGLSIWIDDTGTYRACLKDHVKGIENCV